MQMDFKQGTAYYAGIGFSTSCTGVVCQKGVVLEKRVLHFTLLAKELVFDKKMTLDKRVLPLTKGSYTSYSWQKNWSLTKRCPLTKGCCPWQKDPTLHTLGKRVGLWQKDDPCQKVQALDKRVFVKSFFRESLSKGHAVKLKCLYWNKHLNKHCVSKNWLLLCGKGPWGTTYMLTCFCIKMPHFLIDFTCWFLLIFLLILMCAKHAYFYWKKTDEINKFYWKTMNQ